MKKIFIFMFVLILIAGCTKAEENSDNIQKTGNTSNSEETNIQTSQDETESSDDTEDKKSTSVSDAKAAALAKAMAKIEKEKQESETQVKETNSSSNSSFDDEKYVFSYPYKCNLLGGVQYNYPDKDMTYAEVDAGAIKSIVVVREGLSYHWSDMNGIISSATYSKVEEDAKMPDDLPPEALKMIEDLQETAKKTCVKWNLDTSVFEIPTSVTFVDADELVELDINNPEDMEAMMKMGKALMPDYSNMSEAEIEEFLKKYEK